MPQKSGALNALARIGRRLARPWLGAPAPGTRLDADAFLAHAEALAAKAPPPPGLWLSVLVAEPREPEGAAVEYVVCDAGLTDPAERWARALALARAPFVARLDPGARLTRHAGERIAAALSECEDAAALYTDEIIVTSGGRAEIELKPAFDPVLLDSHDYFGRLAVYPRGPLEALGAWRHDGPDGDYEVALRIAAAAPPGSILHLPYPASIGPARGAPRAAVLTEHFRAQGREIALAPPLRPDRLRPTLRPEPRDWPNVRVVIPSRDAPALIREALAGLFERTEYPAFDVTVVDNGTTDSETLAIYARQDPARFSAEIAPAPFNFSRAVNRGAALAKGDLILLLNNDVEVIEPGWLKEMVAGFDYPQVGVVGAKLIYPDGTLQHAGVIAGLGDYAGHWRIGEPDDPRAQPRLASRQSLSVVTGACLLVSRACFEALGGFDETMFPIAYNDVDFCLRAGAAGFRVLWTPFAKLVHHESATRGDDESGENARRFTRDKAALKARHATDVLEDRAYNPWAVRSHSTPFAVARADLPGPR